MRIARFSHEGDVAFGVVEGDDVAEMASHPFGPVSFTGNRWPLSRLRVLAPVLPSKVVAIGKNYADHATEMGGDVPERPLLFLKPSTAVIGSGEKIAYPPSASRVVVSLLTAVGLPELICDDVKSYVAKAVSLAKDADARKRLREHLHGPGRDGALFNTAATTRAIEAAYLAMAEQYRRQVRETIVVP